MSYQTPRGTYDILPEEIKGWQKMEELLRKQSDLYGYQEIRTPIFESTSVFARQNDSSDMVNKEMYTFMSGSESYTLRPEGTAGVIRSFVQHKLYGSMELPARFCYMGPMFRHERPQKGRQRQFTQYGVENLGARSPLVDAEVIALGYDIVQAMGIKSVKVLINTLGDDASREAYRNALKEHFRPVVNELCGDCQRRYEQNPLRILDCKVDQEHPSLKSAPALKDYLNEESQTYFSQVLSALDALHIPYVVEDRLVRGLDYYTHTVFEVVSTRPDSGAQATVFGGGRYDHLVDYFGGPEMSGIGFAIGLERLLALSKDESGTAEKQEPLDVYVMGLGNVGSIPLTLVQKMRHAGYAAQANLMQRSLKAQFRTADRTQARYLIIVGEEEAKQNKVNLKRTSDKMQVTVDMDQILETIQNWEAEEK